MSPSKDTTLVAEAAVLLKKNAPLPPELRQRILMLSPAARRNAGLGLADLAAQLLREGTEKHQTAIHAIADLLGRIDASLRSTATDAFTRAQRPGRC